MGGKDQQHGIGGVLILYAPYHGRQVKPLVGSVKDELLPVVAVALNKKEGTLDADQKLMAHPMGMFTPGFRTGHIENPLFQGDFDGIPAQIIRAFPPLIVP